jgi:predicted transcriptional regulator
VCGIMFFNEFYKRATVKPIPPNLLRHLQKLKRTGRMREIDKHIEDYNQQIREGLANNTQWSPHVLRDHLVNFKYKYYKKSLA